MGNLQFNVVVVLFWCTTMGWLVVAKILPPLRVGEPPNYASILQETSDEVPGLLEHSFAEQADRLGGQQKRSTQGRHHGFIQPGVSVRIAVGGVGARLAGSRAQAGVQRSWRVGHRKEKSPGDRPAGPAGGIRVARARGQYRGRHQSPGTDRKFHADAFRCSRATCLTSWSGTCRPIR